jgi:phosphinothricin acetyltransferase
MVQRALPRTATPASLRLAQPGDAESIARIYAPNVEGSAISFEQDAPSPEQMRERVLATLQLTPWLVCERAGEVVGYAYASRHRERAAFRWSLEASVYVAASERRRGVGRALYASLFAILRRQGFCAVHALITLPNEPSVRLHEAFGFLPVGVYRAVGFKLGAWRDVGSWQLELTPRSGVPAEPTPLQRLEASAPGVVAEGIAAGVAEFVG